MACTAIRHTLSAVLAITLVFAFTSSPVSAQTKDPCPPPCRPPTVPPGPVVQGDSISTPGHLSVRTAPKGLATQGSPQKGDQAEDQQGTASSTATPNGEN
jgi:hypothetical protein